MVGFIENSDLTSDFDRTFLGKMISENAQIQMTWAQSHKGAFFWFGDCLADWEYGIGWIGAVCGIRFSFVGCQFVG